MQRKLVCDEASIAELIGANSLIERRWSTVRAHQLVRGDITRLAAWERAVASIERRDGRINIVYEDGSTSTIRSNAYMTVDTDGRTRGKRRKRS
jgi:hypothetical protein